MWPVAAPAVDAAPIGALMAAASIVMAYPLRATASNDLDASDIEVFELVAMKLSFDASAVSSVMSLIWSPPSATVCDLSETTWAWRSSALAQASDSASKKLVGRLVVVVVCGKLLRASCCSGVMSLIGILLARCVADGNSEVQRRLLTVQLEGHASRVDASHAVPAGQQRPHEVARAVGGRDVGRLGRDQRRDPLAGIVRDRGHRRRQRLGRVAHRELLQATHVAAHHFFRARQP